VEGTYAVKTDPANPSAFSVSLKTPENLRDITIAVLLTPEETPGASSSAPPAGTSKPAVTVEFGGAAGLVRSGEQEGKSHWYLAELPTGAGQATFTVADTSGAAGGWRGRAYVWLLAERQEKVESLSVNFAGPEATGPMPPVVLGPSVSKAQLLVGEIPVRAGAASGAPR